jgi:uncharacterized membrane protein
MLEVVVGHILRTGVVAAAAAVSIGAVWFLIRHGGEVPDYRVFRAVPANSAGLKTVWSGIAAGHSRSFIQAGLLILIATPVARVAFSLAAFAKQRDYLYAAITTIVLGVLLFSLFGA